MNHKNRPGPSRGLRTSIQNGDLLIPSTQERQLGIILEAFIQAAEDGTGLLDQEGMDVTGIQTSSYRQCRTVLEDMGWVKYSGYYRKGPPYETKGIAPSPASGTRHLKVWVLTRQGAIQAGLEDYEILRARQYDRDLIKDEKAAKLPRKRQPASSRERQLTPEELELQRQRNFLNECRTLISRAVLNFTKGKTPDITEFGNFLGNNGKGSPGFSPSELQQVAKYLQQVAVVFEANRARTNYSPTAMYQPGKDNN